MHACAWGRTTADTHAHTYTYGECMTHPADGVLDQHVGGAEDDCTHARTHVHAIKGAFVNMKVCMRACMDAREAEWTDSQALKRPSR